MENMEKERMPSRVCNAKQCSFFFSVLFAFGPFLIYQVHDAWIGIAINYRLNKVQFFFVFHKIDI